MTGERGGGRDRETHKTSKSIAGSGRASGARTKRSGGKEREVRKDIGYDLWGVL